MIVLYNFLLTALPKQPDQNGLWTDGEQILCRTKEQASTLADLMYLTDKKYCTLGYYDYGQKKGAKVNGRNAYSGWYCLYC